MRWSQLKPLIMLGLMICIPFNIWANGHIHVLNIDSAIGPASAQYISDGIRQANEHPDNVIIIQINTPGGLGSSMLQITESILNSQAPVVVFVSPKGASATSAGAFITYAAPVAAMAPATNIGAASPVPLGGDTASPNDKSGDKDSDTDVISPPQTTGQLKALEDFSARIKAMAERNHRNAKAAVAMVMQGKSYALKDAIRLGIVNLQAQNLNDLIQKLDQYRYTVSGQEKILQTAGKTVVMVTPDWRDHILSILTNPSITYILMLLAVYGILLEFYNPGTFYPGIIGAISGILAGYGLNLLPVNFAGLTLLLLGLALLLVEATLPSYGIFGIGGAVAFILGSLFLFDTSMGFPGISYSLIAAMAVASVSFVALISRFILGAYQQQAVSGSESLVGKDGISLMDFTENRHNIAGQVKIQGTIYQAKAQTPIKQGSAVTVVAVEGIVLVVQPTHTT